MRHLPTPDPQSVRQRTYRGILLLGGMAVASATLLSELGGAAGFWTRAGGIGLSLCFLAALFVGSLARERLILTLIYALLTLSALGWWQALYVLYPQPPANWLLLSIALFLPATYALVFLTFAPTRALLVTVTALCGIALATLPHALGTQGGHGLFDGLGFPLMLVFSHLIIIYLMHSYALVSIGLQQAQWSANQMTQLAYTDELTGVANRRALEIEMVRALNLARRRGWSLALMYIDLDQFKQVNDRYGHGAGDELLVSVARRLGRCLRDMDFLVRLGGDEFAVILQNADVAESVKVCGRVAMEVSAPYELAGQQQALKASIGVAVYPEHGEDLDGLLRNADRAMYIAKSSGGGFAFPEPARERPRVPVAAP